VAVDGTGAVFHDEPLSRLFSWKVAAFASVGAEGDGGVATSAALRDALEAAADESEDPGL
jgi:hypothetical protein